MCSEHWLPEAAFGRFLCTSAACHACEVTRDIMAIFPTYILCSDAFQRTETSNVIIGNVHVHAHMSSIIEYYHDEYVWQI